MKEHPGFWLPPVEKPENVGISSEESLNRIANALPEAAFQIAAQRAAQMGLEYGNSEVFDGDQDYPDERGYSGGGGGGGKQIEANFDGIADDDLYRVARALYKSGQPEQSVEMDDGTIVELHPDDLSILIIRQGRSMNHVDIRVARSIRQLDQMWSQIVG
jgi:hypothetical protein